MMLAKMLQDFVSDLEAKVEQWVGELWQTLDFAKLEEALSERGHGLCAGLLEHLLNERLGEAEWLNELKRLRGRLGMRFKEYRWVTVSGLRDGGVFFVLALPTALRALGYLHAQCSATDLPVDRTPTRDQPPARTL